MIYRETMPPGQAHGQAYNGQQPNRPIQNAQPFQNIQGQPHQPHIGYPQYTNANSNGLNGYAVNGGVAPPYQQQAQYSQPTYPQQPPPQQQHQQQPPQQQPTSYYPNNASHLTNYNAPFNHARPADITPPLEFVNPSFLQNNVPQRPVVQTQPQTQPSPAPVKVEASMSPQLQQITSAKASPKNSPTLSEKKTLPSAKDPRRQVSSGGITKSPVLSQSSTHVETLPILLSIAEDCFSQAGLAAQGVARSMSRPEVEQHHKLVATGLGCLELALKSSKLPPRLEARLCLRYASILTEETTNLMEAETALSRGIAVCEKVSFGRCSAFLGGQPANSDQHRLLDLKYSSVFLLMKTLFQRNQKAAFKSIDGHINECTTYEQLEKPPIPLLALTRCTGSRLLTGSTPSVFSRRRSICKLALPLTFMLWRT